ncbi:MAG: hypothetical protein Q4E41_06875 [Bacteroidales bacterium]|nr:hypothetical protein [Bacteroidales bacterium]
MMNVENFVDTDLLNRLEYGKLYVFINDAHKADAYKSILLSRVRNPEVAEWLSQTTIELVQVPRVNRLGMVIAARKFNAGNIGRYSVLACIIQDLSTLDDGLLTFLNRLTSVEEDAENEDSKFTLILPELGIASDFTSASSIIKENIYFSEPSPQFEKKQKKGWWKRGLTKFLFHEADSELLASEDNAISDDYTDDTTFFQEDNADAEQTMSDRMPSQKENAQLEIVREAKEEDEYANNLQFQRDHDLQLIMALIMDFIQKYQADPTEMIATLLQGKYIVNTMPMLVVNRNRKIIFPEYNEMELKMSAASRTLYIWFLKHPEGCTLSELTEHRSELITIYEEVHPGCNYLEESVDAMLEKDKINQNLSRIKKMVRSIIINDDIASNYYISGKRNGVYRLPISAHPDKVRLPQVLLG